MRQAAILTVLAVAAATGCMPSHKLAEGEFDRYTALHEDYSDQGTPFRAEAGGRVLPAKWIIRQNKSVIWSTVTLVRAAEQLRAGAEALEVSVSPTHAEAMADVLAEARTALDDLGEISEMERMTDRKLWAETLASALVRVEYIARMATLTGAEARAPRGAEPLGLAAEPMLELVALYLDERTGGALLRDIGPKESQRLGSVLTQLALRIGFAAAGKQQPDGLRQALLETMGKTDRLGDLHKALEPILLEGIDRAAPDAGGGEMTAIVQNVLRFAPKALKAMESFVRQWNRMDAVELELEQLDGEIVVVMTVRVLPGKEVRLDDMMLLAPTIAFRGTSRIVIHPKLPGTGEAVVAFEPLADGAVDMRFEGAIYGLAKLLVFPLADGALREIRVFVRARDEGTQIINVAVLMEAKGDKGDPRRLLQFQDIRAKQLVRDAFALASVVGRTEQTFNYLTPTRRYTYQRVKAPPAK